MKKIIGSGKVYVKKSGIPNAGRGVFAKSDIGKGEIIENCPIIEISEYDTAILNKSTLVTYLFYFGKKKERLLIALGFGSIYNHSTKPNATFKIESDQGVINFIATKNIKKDLEITFDYRHGNLKNKKPLWFEV